MILLGCYAGYWLHTPMKPSPQVSQYEPYRPQFYVDPTICACTCLHARARTHTHTHCSKVNKDKNSLIKHVISQC